MVYRVVFQLNESASSKVEGTLRNISHLIEDLGPEGWQVELVAHSDGIAALYRRGNPRADTMAGLAERGVRLAACRRTMEERGLTADDLLPAAQPVPSGIGELVRREAEGWVYVHP